MADDSPPLPPAGPGPWRWWVCVLLLLASTVNYLDRMALNLTGVRIQAAFGLSNAQYGNLESVFTVGFALGTLLAGWLVDRVGVRWVYPAAVVGWSAAGVLTGFAPGYGALLACRVGLGLFEAGNWPCGVRTVRQVMPPAERSLGNAFFQNGTALGAVLTPLIVLACVRWADPGEPARAAAQSVGGGMVTAAAGLPPEGVWQVPFRIIGLVGFGWVLLWLLTVPGRALRPITEPKAATEAAFADVFRDRRYWLLVAVIVGVNTSWHTFRVWLPLYLQKQLGYAESEMSYHVTLYYLAADAGAWAVGLGGLFLARRGVSAHRGRLVMFAVCLLPVLAAAALPFLGRGPALTAVLLAYGFGAFGLFPVYFALSQELSGKHQGKVTGTLGFVNALYLAALFSVTGKVADVAGRYDPFMAVAGLPAALAFGLLVLFWRKSAAAEKSP